MNNKVNKIVAKYRKDNFLWEFRYYDSDNKKPVATTDWPISSLGEESDYNEIKKEVLYAAENWLKIEVLPSCSIFIEN